MFLLSLLLKQNYYSDKSVLRFLDASNNSDSIVKVARSLNVINVRPEAPNTFYLSTEDIANDADGPDDGSSESWVTPTPRRAHGCHTTTESSQPKSPPKRPHSQDFSSDGGGNVSAVGYSTGGSMVAGEPDFNEPSFTDEDE